MYLDKLSIENFRMFGSRANGKAVDLTLNPGINLFVGPNDAGKTCLIDAVRLLVGTVTGEFFSIGEDDFHISGGTRAASFSIVGEFRGISSLEAGAFLEYLSIETVGGQSRYFLRLCLGATLQDTTAASSRRRRIRFEFRAGSDSEGIRFEGAARDLLAATYLKPLRDAVFELGARKGSRLSQILRAYKHMEGHDASDWTEGSPDEPRKLLGIAKKADHMLRTSDVVQKAQDDLNRLHLNEFSIGDTPLTGKIEPSGQELRHILERLELSLSDAESNRCRGLGIHNLLFMATELLALAPNEDADLPLLLIEEPEAHLHPQYQQRLIDYIRQRAKRTRDDGRDKLQILLTTHSPQFAAHVPLNGITLVHTGTTFSLRREEAKLDSSDYEFLERFLDVTKANLFFARGVIVVEGDAEALLLPVLARKLGRPLEKYGVSIVNVGHTGLFRYSRILQRQAGPELPVRVACICDRDIPPLAAVKLVKEGRKTEDKYQPAEVTDKINLLSQNDAQNVKTFVSPHWTFEHDLARGGLARLVHRAISVARKSRLLRQFPVGRDYDERLREADESFRNWKLLNWSEERIAVEIYTPLSKNRASKAEVAQALAMMLDKLPDQYVARRLPGYIIDAITYATSGP